MTIVFYPLPEIEKAGQQLAISPEAKGKKKRKPNLGVDLAFERDNAKRKFSDAEACKIILHCFEFGIESAVMEYDISYSYAESIRLCQSRRKAWIMAEAEYIARHGTYPPDRVPNSERIK